MMHACQVMILDCVSYDSCSAQRIQKCSSLRSESKSKTLVRDRETPSRRFAAHSIFKRLMMDVRRKIVGFSETFAKVASEMVVLRHQMCHVVRLLH